MTGTPAVVPPRVTLAAARPQDGCTGTGCGSQATVQLHPHLGRRCPLHVTLPPGGFRTDLAADMVDTGHHRSAFGYLLAWLVAEADHRFAAAAARLIPAGSSS